MLNKVFDGIRSAVVISIGCSVFLACENRVIGAVLFSVALITICLKGYNLYTGRIGFIPEKHSREDVSSLLLGLLGNVIGSLLFGLLIRSALANLGETALTLCTAKLTQTAYSTLVRGFFCGILMYIAVSTFREKNTLAGVLFCVPVFILSGFEHSIADMVYFAMAGIISPDAFVFILLVLLGNTLGAMLLPVLGMVGRKDKA
ncbi:MAG: formate/nitrite transporter family protein [Oscillospiraceae bacterium]|nr:formate/nitrite transporter family protein [Oscillospiraceae bacterium]